MLLTIVQQLFVKSEYIHIDRKHFPPLVLIFFWFISFNQLLANDAGCEPRDICDFELQLCDTQPSIIAGALKEFVFSGRLDNLCSSFCSLKVWSYLPFSNCI